MTISDREFQEGLRLFNSGAFWHAHEQWEACWRQASEPEATLYKGLIQAAAALVHWQRANPIGLRRNWHKARPRLVAVASMSSALDLAGFITQMDHFVTAVDDSRPNIADLVPALSLH
jgi:predicted metal-dependent hydrolase